METATMKIHSFRSPEIPWLSDQQYSAPVTAVLLQNNVNFAKRPGQTMNAPGGSVHGYSGVLFEGV